jgi:hypothetical protein
VPRAKRHLGQQAYRVALQFGHPSDPDEVRALLKLQVVGVTLPKNESRNCGEKDRNQAEHDNSYLLAREQNCQKKWLFPAGEKVNWKIGGSDLSTLLAGNNYESGLMIRKKINPKKGVQVLHVRRTWTPFLFARLVSSRKTS